jgi:hypothetical protein
VSFAVYSAILPAFGFGTFVSNGGQFVPFGFITSHGLQKEGIWPVFTIFKHRCSQRHGRELNSKITNIQKRSSGLGSRDHFKISAISILAGLNCIRLQLLMEEPGETQWHS